MTNTVSTNKDIIKAKKILPGHSLVLCKNEELIISDKKGISAIADFIISKKSLCGFSAADKVIGKAAAILFIKAEIKEVFAETLSVAGKEILEKHNIAVSYNTLTENISNFNKTDICPMEKLVSKTFDIEIGTDLLLKKLNEFKKV